MGIGLRRIALSCVLAMVASTTAWSEDIVHRIGLVSAQSGQFAFLGDPFNKAARLAVEKANNRQNGKGVRYELISYDSEGSADKALNFVKKLIFDHKVSIILGPDFAGHVRAVLPTSESAGVPVLYNTPNFDPAPRSYQFTPWPSEEASYRASLGALQRRNVKRLSVLIMGDATGESGQKWIEKLAPGFGMTLGLVEHFDPRDRDVGPQMAKIKANNPDAVFAVLSGGAVAILAKSYVRLGMKQPLMLSTGAVSVTFPELLKGITPETLLFTGYKMLVFDKLPKSEPGYDAIVDFASLFQTAYGRKPDFFAGAGWDLANLAIRTIDQVGDDRALIRDALEKVSGVEGTMGVISFSPEKHRGTGPSDLVVGQFKDGQFVVLPK